MCSECDGFYQDLQPDQRSDFASWAVRLNAQPTFIAGSTAQSTGKGKYKSRAIFMETHKTLIGEFWDVHQKQARGMLWSIRVVVTPACAEDAEQFRLF